MMHKSIFFLLAILLAACGGTKKTTDPGSLQGNDITIASSTKCKIPGVVRDYSKMDGCQFLIELENGEKWLPAKMEDTTFQFADGQNIIFGYKEIKDGISICMAESKMIEVTCIKLNTNEDTKPIVKECFDISDAMKVPWMADIVNKYEPIRITKYDFRDGWAYMIFTKDDRLFYDCQGTNLCPATKGETRDCMTRYMSLISNKVEIYVEGPDKE